LRPIMNVTKENPSEMFQNFFPWCCYFRNNGRVYPVQYVNSSYFNDLWIVLFCLICISSLRDKMHFPLPLVCSYRTHPALTEQTLTPDLKP
jgi:hypothetical protein